MQNARAQIHRYRTRARISNRRASKARRHGSKLGAASGAASGFERDIEALFQPEPREVARDIPFAALLENGLLEPGEKLESKCRKFQASINADGDLTHQKRRASIHKLAAELAGRQSCNGWTYWHYLAQSTVVKNAPQEKITEKAGEKTAGKTTSEVCAGNTSQENTSQENTEKVGAKVKCVPLRMPLRVPLDELRQALRATLKQVEDARQASEAHDEAQSEGQGEV